MLLLIFGDKIIDNCLNLQIIFKLFSNYFMKAINRVIQYIDSKGVSNSSFEKRCGLSNGYLGTQLKRNADLGEGILNKILDNCLDLGPEWLLTGRGDMLKPEHENQSSEITIVKGNRRTSDAMIESQEIPLYDLDATAGLSAFFKGDKKASIIDTIKIPNAPRCDGAFGVVGDSMVPLLRSGDTILYKEVPLNIDYIMFGEMYVLSYDLGDWEEVIAVKYIHKSKKGKNYIKLVSENPNHADKNIPFASIRALALVKVTIRFNTPY